MDSWNSREYGQFLDLRTRPAKDLLAATPDSFYPKSVYDLGCGPGNSTGLLKNRWPDADVIGVDSSLNMLNEARVSHPGISFIQKDIADFSPAEKIDYLFANASLQWLDRHEILFPRLMRLLRNGGAFGIQMPNNFHAPSHQVIIKLLQADSNWQPLLKHLRYGALKEPFYKLAWYYDLLTAAGAKHLQIWETEYFQEIADHQAIFDWVKSTGLRPVLSQMDTDNQREFEKLYVKTIAKEYSSQINSKILLPYKRIFMSGHV